MRRAVRWRRWRAVSCSWQSLLTTHRMRAEIVWFSPFRRASERLHADGNLSTGGYRIQPWPTAADFQPYFSRLPRPACQLGLGLPDRRYHPWGGAEEFQNDPYWRGHVFHGDNGADMGTSHQTGWTGPTADPTASTLPPRHPRELVAPLIEIFGHLDAEAFLAGGSGGRLWSRVSCAGRFACRRR